MPKDEFDRLTEGLHAPDPDVEGAALAGRQLGAVWCSLKAFGVPDSHAEYLVTQWMAMGAAPPEEQGQ